MRDPFAMFRGVDFRSPWVWVGVVGLFVVVGLTVVL
jgi:hypothetical protein